MDHDLDMLEEALGYFVHAMSRPRVWEAIQHEAGLTIERPSAHLLKILGTTGSGCQLHELADRLGIEAPSVTRTVQQLESGGFVRRIAEPNDRRATRITITPRGQKVIERLHHAQRERFRAMLSGWSPYDRKQLVQQLHRLFHQAADQSIPK